MNEILLVEHTYDCMAFYSQYLEGFVLLRKEFEDTFPKYLLNVKLIDEMWKKELGTKEKEKNFLFITISPRVGTTLIELKKRTENLVKRPFMGGVRYCYEQSGKTEDEIGYHPHVHLVVSKVSGYSPKQVKDRIDSTFKGLGNQKMVDVREYPESFRTEKILYLNGTKWDTGKESSVKLNKIWREKNALENIYSL